MKVSVLISYAANMRHKNVKKEQKHKLFIKKQKNFFLIRLLTIFVLIVSDLIVSLRPDKLYEYVT